MTEEDRTMEIPKGDYDELQASLQSAKSDRDDAETELDETKAALSEATDKVDSLQSDLDALDPITDVLRAALQAQSDFSEDFFDGMSASRMVSAVDDPTDLFATEPDGGEGVEGEGVGSSGEADVQTGAGEEELDAETEEQVAALQDKRKTLESMDWDSERALSVVDEQIAALQGGSA